MSLCIMMRCRDVMQQSMMCRVIAMQSVAVIDVSGACTNKHVGEQEVKHVEVCPCVTN